MSVCRALTAAKQGTFLAPGHQLHRHGFSRLRNGKSSCLIGFDEGDVDDQTSSGPRSHGGHLTGYD